MFLSAFNETQISKLMTIRSPEAQLYYAGRRTERETWQS